MFIIFYIKDNIKFYIYVKIVYNIGGTKMENKQKICCTVGSCKYNDSSDGRCTLNEIIVTPNQGCDTKEPDESKCSSYEYDY